MYNDTMEFDLDTFKKRLDSALALFDKEAVNHLCDEFIHYLYGSTEPAPARTLELLLQALRNKRMFVPMQKLGDCFIALGLQTCKIRRQYAQSLIDQGIYAAPLAILQELRSETKSDPDPSAANEYAEATGLIGRIYKQQYVNAAGSQNPRRTRLLEQAIASYQEVYFSNPDLYLWHGINLVALLYRAQSDPIGQAGLPEPAPIALEILSRIEDLDMDRKATAWDYAIACEACIALDRPDESLYHLDKYINCSVADAFEIGSTLRQLQEAWGLTMDSPFGQQLLPLLSAALLRREGATLTISTADLEKHKSSADAHSKDFEQLLSGDSFRTYQWYVKGLKACSAVARIGVDTTLPKGTGFLLDGALLAEEHRGKTLLLTNAHVVSDDSIKNNGSLYVNDAVATLEVVDKDLELKFDGIIRTSNIFELDTTILSFDESAQEKLRS
ncbi:MAG TPA: tetratricopeptide repeat-containing protein, partial [Puia sp.]|nr:tetratricopeptide repeat-containing protein [Puia sp.]